MAKRWPPASQEERLWWNQPYSHPDLGLLASKSEKGILPLKPPTLECSVMTAWPLTYSFNSTLSLKKKKNFLLKKILFIYSCMQAFSTCSKRGYSLSSCGARSSCCSGFSHCGAQDLRASVAVALRLSCPAACGISRDQGSNPCRLYLQVESLPLDHQGSPNPLIL